MKSKRDIRLAVSIFLSITMVLILPGLSIAGSLDPTPLSLTGWLSIIWGDSKDESSMIYTLTDEKGQRTVLKLDEKVAKSLGGVLQFNGKYVSVQGMLATPSYTRETFGATSGATQSPPAVLNVI